MFRDLEQIIAEADGRAPELRRVYEHLLSESADLAEQKRILTLINAAGISASLLTPLAELITSKSQPFAADFTGAIDTCGTGGSGRRIFNCSTLTAFVLASLGQRVLKHGNRGVTSQSGSADFLSRAGVNLSADRLTLQRAYAEFNIAFLFAPQFHPQLKNVAQARQELGTSSIFNVLGPLVNPANPSYQMIGTADTALNREMIKVLKSKNLKRAAVFTSADGIDEVSITAETHITELRDGKITTWTLNPADYGLRTASIADIQVQNAEAAGQLGTEILSGAESPASDMVSLNAGLGLFIAGTTDSVAAGVQSAQQQLRSGSVLPFLKRYAKFTQG